MRCLTISSYLIFLIVLLFAEPALAQLTGGEAFLQGNYAEAGLRSSGAFGTDQDAPVGYHPRPGSGSKLGFVADRGQDGWAVGSPVYDGDFFLPGTPFEGWGVYAASTSYNNYNGAAAQMAGSLSGFVSNAGGDSVSWTGTAGDISISKTMSIGVNDTEITIDVTLTNTSGSEMTNVYYCRAVDPDNNQSINSNYATTNTVQAQPPIGSTATVSATQTDGSYIALTSIDARARVSYGGDFGAFSCSDIWNGTWGSTSGSTTHDKAIALSLKFDSIGAGGNVNFSYKYTLTQPPSDFGDAPSSYPVSFANNGARHDITVKTVYLGADVDDETDGQSNADATGDDTAGSTPDDEDGVTFTSDIEPQVTVTLNVVSNTNGKLNAWIDFNRDNDWEDAGEQVFTDEDVAAGTNNLSFTAPSGFTAGTSYARFRVSTAGGLSSTGPAANGEVEDHQVTLIAGSIGGTIWNDTNGDGASAGESGVENVTLSLYVDDGDSVFEPGADDGAAVGTATTNGSGVFDFASLPASAYWVSVTDTGDVIDGMTLTGGTEPLRVVLSAGQDYSSANFG